MLTFSSVRFVAGELWTLEEQLSKTTSKIYHMKSGANEIDDAMEPFALSPLK